MICELVKYCCTGQMFHYYISFITILHYLIVHHNFPGSVRTVQASRSSDELYTILNSGILVQYL